MPTVAYKVAPDGEKWLVTRNGEPGMSYVSQEAAYEVATAEAAGDLGLATRSGSKSLDQPTGGPATVLVLPWRTGGQTPSPARAMAAAIAVLMFLILRVRHWLPVAGRTARARQHRSGAPTP
jgi:hypothetical protein